MENQQQPDPGAQAPAPAEAGKPHLVVLRIEVGEGFSTDVFPPGTVLYREIGMVDLPPRAHRRGAPLRALKAAGVEAQLGMDFRVLDPEAQRSFKLLERAVEPAERFEIVAETLPDD